jgi:hypothetical protein
MTPALIQLLEALSGHRAVFPAGHPQAGQNPVNFSHLRYDDGGRRSSILSRTCAAGLDYSGRGNTFSHHVVLNEAELPAGGPAWALMQPGFLDTQWDGQVRYLDAGKAPPLGDSTPRPCQRWQRVTGDAGWGGVVAEACLNRSRHPVYLVYEPGMDLLPLIAESLALIPVQRRWSVTFSTYYTGTPFGLECQVRGILTGSPEHARARRETNVLLIDLTLPVAPAGNSDWAAAGRHGQPPEQGAAPPPPRRERSFSPPPPSRHGEPVEMAIAELRGIEAVEARLAAPTPPRPFPAPPRMDLEPLPPAPPPIVAKPTAAAGRSAGGTFLLLSAGLICGLVLGIAGMALPWFLSYQNQEDKIKAAHEAREVEERARKKAEKERDDATMARTLEASARVKAEGDKDAADAHSKAVEQRAQNEITAAKAEAEGIRAAARQEIIHAKGQLEAERKKDADQRQAQAQEIEAHHRKAQRRHNGEPLPVKSDLLDRGNGSTLYFHLETFDPDREYQFTLPVNFKPQRMGFPGALAEIRPLVFLVPRTDAPEDPLVGLFTYREEKNSLFFYVMGPTPWLPEQRQQILEVLRSCFIQLEDGAKHELLIAFRPYQDLQPLKVGPGHLSPSIELSTATDKERPRLTFKDVTIRLITGVEQDWLKILKAEEKEPRLSKWLIVPGSYRSDRPTPPLAVVTVKTVTPSGFPALVYGKKPRIEVQVDKAQRLKDIVKEPLIPTYEELLRNLTFQIQDLSVVIDAGNGVPCILAGIKKFPRENNIVPNQQPPQGGPLPSALTPPGNK